jgi:hypothetical protein
MTALALIMLSLAGCNVPPVSPSNPPAHPHVTEVAVTEARVKWDADLRAQVADPAWREALISYVRNLDSEAVGPETQLNSETAIDVTPVGDLPGFSRFCAMPEDRKAFYRALASVRLSADASRDIAARFRGECGARLLRLTRGEQPRWALVYGGVGTFAVIEVDQLNARALTLLVFAPR